MTSHDSPLRTACNFLMLSLLSFGFAGASESQAQASTLPAALASSHVRAMSAVSIASLSEALPGTDPGDPTTTSTTGTPCQLAFVMPPSTTVINKSINPEIQVGIEDCSGNLLTTATNAVSVTMASGVGIRGNLTQTAVKGIASIPVSYNTAGVQTIVASSAGLTSVTSAAFTITPLVATPCKLAFVVPPSKTVINQAVNPEIQVGIEDCSGNLLTTATNTVSLTIASGSGIRGNLTQLAVKGIASISVSYNVAGAQSITASSTGLTSVTSAAFTITPITAVACKLAFVVPPSTTTINQSVNPEIQVGIEDCSGNLLTTATNTVSLAVASGSGIRGNLTQTAVRGIASIPVSYNVAGVQSIIASSTGLTSVTSSAFTINGPIPTSNVTAQSADAMVDSAGINVHLGYLGTPNADFSSVENALVQLGVRHIRDGISDPTWTFLNSEYNQLGQLGIKATFITDVGQTPATWNTYKGLMSLSFEGFESPNEYDNRGITAWAAPLKAEITSLAETEAASATPYPVYGPTFTGGAASLELIGNLTGAITYGNMHNYPAWNNPGTLGWGGLDAEGNGYGSLAWNLDLDNMDAPGLPVVTTESGYTNGVTTNGNTVPEAVSAVYLPRLLLMQWANGIKRTYLYELLSSGGEDYGLFRTDWTAKPAFYAVSNLLNLLSDSGKTLANPGALNYGMTGGGSTLKHLLFQKSDGSFYLALWLETSEYNVNAAAPFTVAPQAVKLQLGKNSTVTGYQWAETGNVSTTSYTATTSAPLALSVSDRLMILKIVQ